MPEPSVSRRFVYVAARPSGARAYGLRAAGSERDLANELGEDRLLLLRAWRAPGGAGAKEKTISLKDQAGFNEQLASLLNRGAPLTEALEVAQSVVSTGAAQRVRKVREAVAGGDSFADACARVGGFDTVTVGVYRAAERTGELDEAARRLHAAAKRRLLVQGKVGTMLIYPAMVISIAFIIATIMLIVVVPIIGETLVDMNAGKESELPGYTLALMAVSNFIRGEWVYVLAGLALLVATGMFLRRAIAEVFSALLRKIPTFRRLVTASELTRLFSVLGAMTKSGVPLSDALAVSVGSVSEPALRAQLDTLQKELVEGGVLRGLLEKADQLPLSTRRLLMASDRAGDLDAAFDGLADDLAAEVDKGADRLLAVVEPALIIGMFLVIGAMMASLFYPIINSTSGSL